MSTRGVELMLVGHRLTNGPEIGAPAGAGDIVKQPLSSGQSGWACETRLRGFGGGGGRQVSCQLPRSVADALGLGP